MSEFWRQVGRWCGYATLSGAVFVATRPHPLEWITTALMGLPVLYGGALLLAALLRLLPRRDRSKQPD